MDRFKILSNAEFQPFTYDDYLKPVADSISYINKVGDSISDLSSKTSLLDRLNYTDKNSEAYNIYNDFDSKLSDIATKFSKYGVDSIDDKDLLLLKSKFNKNIKPILSGLATRDKLTDSMAKEQASKGNVMFSIDPANISIDDLIANPNINYSSETPDNIAKISSEAFGNLSKKFIDNPVYAKKILGGDYNMFMQRYGYDLKNIMKVLNGEGDDSVINEISNEIEDSLNVKNWSTYDKYKDAIKSSIKRGIWSAVGNDKMSISDNWEKKSAVNNMYDMRKIAYQNAHKEKMLAMSDPNAYGWSPKTGIYIKDQNGNQYDPNDKSSVLQQPVKKGNSNVVDKNGNIKDGVPIDNKGTVDSNAKKEGREPAKMSYNGSIYPYGVLATNNKGKPLGFGLGGIPLKVGKMSDTKFNTARLDPIGFLDDNNYIQIGASLSRDPSDENRGYLNGESTNDGYGKRTDNDTGFLTYFSAKQGTSNYSKPGIMNNKNTVLLTFNEYKNIPKRVKSGVEEVLYRKLVKAFGADVAKFYALNMSKNPEIYKSLPVFKVSHSNSNSEDPTSYDYVLAMPEEINDKIEGAGTMSQGEYYGWDN